MQSKSYKTATLNIISQKTTKTLSSPSSQSLLLQIGEAMLEEEACEAEKEKRQYMEEKCPTFSNPGCMPELQVNLHHLDAGWRTETLRS